MVDIKSLKDIRKAMDDAPVPSKNRMLYDPKTNTVIKQRSGNGKNAKN